ncbi:Lysophospholipase L1 [Polaromonas sp. YR568]|uniref:SGNH/GDSL hydrolase family protein n=1 Tax=Polaromonas sp. YR568 TaxID=1855301 RepID=UPI0008E1B088|nr:GDSL-type esterase/lipase family protein [Polaromonas sp. YR568]SFU60942.1 Lysophospholipase L1 [Polaromonas sp. YR568]
MTSMFNLKAPLRSALLILVLAFGVASCGTAPQTQPSRNLGHVLLLGDSITQAAVGNKGYRYPLWKHLVDGGYQFDFIGSLTHNFDANNTASTTSVSPYPDYAGRKFDTRNEGHWGWKTTDILGKTAPTRTPGTGAGKLPDWLAGYTPDTVVILLGINDIRVASAQSVAATKANMKMILDALKADNPKVLIYLASVLSTKADFAEPQKIRELNEAYKELAGQYAAIRYINIYPKFDPAIHSYDGVHPNSQGEQVLADAIYEAMKR